MISEEDILELYRKASTEIPSDVVRELEKAKGKENGNPRKVLERILENIEIAKKEKKPVCQDTGIPIFYVKGRNQSENQIREIIKRATEMATGEIPLRPNAIDPVTGKAKGNVPLIYFEESGKFGIDLLMKGGGSENVSRVYSLPDSGLKAGRDLEGVRKCVLDAVVRAQGRGCPPYVIGVAIGGNIEEVAHSSKKQLLRRLDDVNENPELKKLEKELLEEINRLGIGPSGLGGNTTALAVKISKSYRHPASFFVGVAFGCWALRRASHGN